MAAPWTCASCRLRLSPTIKHTRFLRVGARWLSEIQSNLQQTDVRGVADTASEYVPSPWSKHSGEVKAPACDGGDERQSSVGRYSGKELRPEHLLEQLEQTNTPNPTARQQRRNQYAQSRRNQQRAQATSTVGPRFKLRHIDKASTPDRSPAASEDHGILRPTWRAPIPTRVQQLSADYQKSVWETQDWIAAWHTLQELAKLYDPSTKDPTSTDLLNLPNMLPTTSQLLYGCTEAWLTSLAHDPTMRSTPTPYDILLLTHRLQYTKSVFYRPTLWEISRRLHELRTENAEKTEQTIRVALDNLMGIWRLCIGGHLAKQSFSKNKQARNRALTSIADQPNNWSFLPSPVVFAPWHEEDRSAHTMFEEMLAMLVQWTSGKSTHVDRKMPLHLDYASAALVTLDLLRTTPLEPQTSLFCADAPQYAPFASLLEGMLAKADAPRVPAAMQKRFSELGNPEQEKQYYAMLDRLQCDTSNLRKKADAQEPQIQVSTPVAASVRDFFASPEWQAQFKAYNNVEFANPPQEPKVEAFALQSIKRLGRAVENQNNHMAERLQTEIHAFAQSDPQNKTALPLEVLEHLMLALLSLRDAKGAVQTWQLIQDLGYKPTVKTYTAMMRGAQVGRDILGLEAVWRRMRRAGLQPDAYAWSIRLHGLIKLRSGVEGLQALKEMGEEWFAAARAKEAASHPGRKLKVTPAELLSKYTVPVDGVTRPTLEVMNAVIAGLATSRPADIPTVFKWGRSFGIEPNLFTFNALLGVSMRNNRQDEALAILDKMQSRGIQADSTTWTTLLRALFASGFLDNTSQEEQEQKVLTFIKTLEDKDNGLPGLDSISYALIMDTLSKRYSNARATLAVFSHMRSKGLTPTTQIYTILITVFFQRQPQPDFAAIENLWHEVQDQGRSFMAAVDTTFFDRMVEGYAANHHLVGTKPMEDLLRCCRGAGKKPGWTALKAVAYVWWERQNWDKLRALVDQTLLSMRNSSGGKMLRRGESDFWNFIHETGVLDNAEFRERVERERSERSGSALAAQQ